MPRHLLYHTQLARRLAGLGPIPGRHKAWIALRIPSEIHSAVKQLANDSGRSVSAVVRDMIERALQQSGRISVRDVSE